MKERGLIFRLGNFALYRELIKIGKIVYIAKPIRFSDYRILRLVNCEIRRLPWFRGEYSVLCDLYSEVDGNKLYLDGRIVVSEGQN